MAKRSTFTPEFKAEVVIEALCGQTSQAELCRKHNISDVQFSSGNDLTRLYVILHQVNLREKLVLTKTEF